MSGKFWWYPIGFRIKSFFPNGLRSQAQDQLQVQQPLPQRRQPRFAEVAAGFQLQETPGIPAIRWEKAGFHQGFIWDFMGW